MAGTPLLLRWSLVNLFLTAAAAGLTLFIWMAENIGTFAHAWTYPGQVHAWQMVGVGKLGSWFLLMLISFVLVGLVSPIQPPPAAERTDERPDEASIH